jgi:hypothetical protein
LKESHDRATTSTEIHPKGLKAYWVLKNLSSVDGLPGLLTAPDSAKVTRPSAFDKEGPRPKLHRLSSRNADMLSTTGAALAVGFAIGALVATALPRILSATGYFSIRA